MKITFIEPTPSPNSMMLRLDETLEPGFEEHIHWITNGRLPWIRQLLHIPGVKSVFHTLDFIALDRKGNADWPSILGAVQEIFGQEGLAAGLQENAEDFALERLKCSSSIFEIYRCKSVSKAGIRKNASVCQSASPKRWPPSEPRHSSRSASSRSTACATAS